MSKTPETITSIARTNFLPTLLATFDPTFAVPPGPADFPAAAAGFRSLEMARFVAITTVRPGFLVASALERWASLVVFIRFWFELGYSKFIARLCSLFSCRFMIIYIVQIIYTTRNSLQIRKEFQTNI
jgi:hypothetical protein